jgi:hypothetical protein
MNKFTHSSADVKPSPLIVVKIGQSATKVTLGGTGPIYEVWLGATGRYG